MEALPYFGTPPKPARIECGKICSYQDWRVHMNSFAKLGSAILFVVLCSMAASPVSHAQSGPYPNLIQLNVAEGGYLGIQMDDVTAANMSKFNLTAEKGVIVRSVVKGAPAEKAGLHEADVILEYAGTQVWSSMQFTRLVQETPPGRKVGLGVSRAGKRVSLTAEIGKRDEGRADNRYRELLGMFPERPLDRRETLILPAEPPAGKPRLGLTLQPLSDQLAQFMGVPGKKGVLVSNVLEGSLAAGKIRAGDVIIAADGKEVREPEELTRIVRDKAEGILALKIIRDKKEIAVDVSLPALPAGEGRGLKL
jgi:serine protease Do